MVVRDLRIHVQALDGEVEHFRDSGGLGINAISQIDSSKSGKPAVPAAIVATGYGYVRADGIQIVRSRVCDR
jgi:hypothetical protein